MPVKFYLNIKKSHNLKSNGNGLNGNGLFFKGDNGCTVVLIHGLTGTPNEMRFLAISLNKKGYTVICPRLANHGEPVEILKKTKWQEFYQSAKEAFIGIREDNKAIFVSGLSMGALLALLLADEFQGRVAGVSCLSPTLYYDGWNTPWSKYLLPLAYITPLKHFFYFKEAAPYGIKNEQIREMVHKFYNNAKINDMEGVARYGYPYFPVTLFCQLRLLVKHMTNRLANVNAPVQLIQAKDDDMTSVKNSQFIYDRIGSKTKEIVLLYNSYHVITADQERDVVAEKMEEFFNNLCYNLKQ